MNERTSVKLFQLPVAQTIKTAFLALWLLSVCVSAAAQPATQPIDTAFTYQGELRDQNAAPTGNYDIEFRLYENASGGTAIATFLATNVPVQNGLFTTLVDFGDVYQGGNGEWMELRVRAGGSSGGYTSLLPRQSLTATPYAIRANRVAPNSISTHEIINGTILNEDIANATITADKLAPGVLGRTVSIAIPASAFRPMSSSQVSQTGTGAGGTYLVGATTGALIAPLILPHRSKITKMRAVAFDGAAGVGENVKTELKKLNYTTGSWSTSASVETFGSGGYQALTVTLTTDTVQSTYYSYDLVVTGALASNRRIMAVEITYELPDN